MKTRSYVNYTLLILSESECKECFSKATHLLLGKEDELLGFYCYTHGRNKHELLEQKYTFQQETKLVKERSQVSKLRKTIHKKKKGQNLLQLAVSILALDSQDKEKLAELIKKVQIESLNFTEINL